MSRIGQSARNRYSKEWLAVSTVRMGLAVVGFIVLLFAVGQMVGFNLLELVIAAATSHTGSWLLVAVFAVLLIALAVRGFNDLFA